MTAKEKLQIVGSVIELHRSLTRKEQYEIIMGKLGCKQGTAKKYVREAIAAGYGEKRDSGGGNSGRAHQVSVKFSDDEAPEIPTADQMQTALVQLYMQIMENPEISVVNKMIAAKQATKLYGLESPEYHLYRKNRNKKEPTAEEVMSASALSFGRFRRLSTLKK